MDDFSTKLENTLERQPLNYTEIARMVFWERIPPETVVATIRENKEKYKNPRRFRDLASGDEQAREYLKQAASDYGFSSVDELRKAIVALREELKTQLSPEDFQAYFGRSLDIT